MFHLLMDMNQHKYPPLRIVSDQINIGDCGTAGHVAAQWIQIEGQ